MVERFSVVSDENVQKRLHFDFYIISYTCDKGITNVVTRLLVKKWNDIVQNDLAEPHKDNNAVRAAIEHLITYWCQDRLKNWTTGSAPGYLINNQVKKTSKKALLICFCCLG